MFVFQPAVRNVVVKLPSPSSEGFSLQSDALSAYVNTKDGGMFSTIINFVELIKSHYTCGVQQCG